METISVSPTANAETIDEFLDSSMTFGKSQMSWILFPILRLRQSWAIQNAMKKHHDGKWRKAKLQIHYDLYTKKN